jgi:hypothetical protein
MLNPIVTNIPLHGSEQSTSKGLSQNVYTIGWEFRHNSTFEDNQSHNETILVSR